MMKKDPRVDAYIAKAPPFARPILARFRKAVHAGCPEVTETLKWSVPHFDYRGVLGGMAAFKEHCRVGFWKESLLTSAPTGTSGPMIRVASLADMPDERTIVKMAREAAALNAAGVKVKRVPKAPKKPLKAPAYLLAALRKNRKAHAAYQAFSPSHQREYIEWITGAKAEETRNRRLETAVAWMAEGKSRNWKYQR
jgi:uncharacterized protein YdeI (YjbR/CyaY-like superfamily)